MPEPAAASALAMAPGERLTTPMVAAAWLGAGMTGAWGPKPVVTAALAPVVQYLGCTAAQGAS